MLFRSQVSRDMALGGGGLVAEYFWLELIDEFWLYVNPKVLEQRNATLRPASSGQ